MTNADRILEVERTLLRLIKEKQDAQHLHFRIGAATAIIIIAGVPFALMAWPLVQS